jgi:hypothetical protein
MNLSLNEGSELAAVGAIRSRLDRAADRYAATGRLTDSRRLQRFAAQVQFLGLKSAMDAEKNAASLIVASAVASGVHDVLHYVVIEGQVRVDGSRTWRTNNPGGLHHGAFARDHGALGSDGSWAVYPDMPTGTAALLSYLGTEDAQNLTPEALLARMVKEDDAAGDLLTQMLPLAGSLSVTPGLSFSSFSLVQLTAFANMMAMWSSGSFGHVYRDSVGAPKWVCPFLRNDEGVRGIPGEPTSLLRTSVVLPADHYQPAKDLCIVTCFFNISGSKARLNNITRFLKTLTDSGVAWSCVECAFGNSPFALPDDNSVLRVRSNSVLWQKERLLNLAIRRLDDNFEKVAWVDADVLFSRSDWITRTSEALDDYPVVQPFSEGIRLPPRIAYYVGRGDRVTSFAHLYATDPDSVTGPSWHNHGHTGLAWAAQRDWIDYNGLYDACLSGNGDHVMAHAFVGTWDSECTGIVASRFSQHFRDWSRSVYGYVKSRMGCVPGQALTLWHGDQADRNYYESLRALNDLDFDPARDLRHGRDGEWEWATDNEALHHWSGSFLCGRFEDGREGLSHPYSCD